MILTSWTKQCTKIIKEQSAFPLNLLWATLSVEFCSLSIHLFLKGWIQMKNEIATSKICQHLDINEILGLSKIYVNVLPITYIWCWSLLKILLINKVQIPLGKNSNVNDCQTITIKNIIHYLSCLTLKKKAILLKKILEHKFVCMKTVLILTVRNSSK